jgi:hypothetical protein
MNDEHVKAMAAKFDQHKQSESSRHKWHWASGVILFPEALCPSCNGVMRSTRIWRVDELGQRLLGVVYISDDKLVKVTRRVHPHVDGSSGGPICVGNAKSASEALFFGVGMGTPHWTAKPDWYKEVFDHECGNGSTRISRNHLTESIKLADKVVAEVKKAVPEPEPEPRLFNGGALTVEGISAAGRSGLRLDDL